MLGWSYVLRSVLTGLAYLAALIAGFQMISGQVPGDGGVKPSGGVTFGNCMDVPVPPLASPAQTTAAGTLVNAQTSVEAAYLPQWFGGGVPLDGVLGCTIGVPGEAGLKEQGATAGEKMLLDGVRNVGVLGLPCLTRGLESYRAGITRGV